MSASLALVIVMIVVSGTLSDRVYEEDRMYRAPEAFQQSLSWLRGLRPTVLRLNSPQLLALPSENLRFAGPPSLGPPAYEHKTMGMFNPSIARAPRGLCPRCAYVLTLRVDPLHQCDASSPLLATPSGSPIATGAWFKGTALGVADHNMSVLAWTWYLARPEDQVNAVGFTSRWFVPPASHGLFPPPWSKPAYDVRLLNFDEQHIFATFNCKACTFSVALLQITGRVTPDGGITRLRAWSVRRFRAGNPWMQGRNQAVFAATLPPDSTPSMLVQPWLGLIGDFGHPHFNTADVMCYPRYPVETLTNWTHLGGEELNRLNWQLRGRSLCGPTRPRARLLIPTIETTAREAIERRKYNRQVRALVESWNGTIPGQPPYSRVARRHFTLKTRHNRSNRALNEVSPPPAAERFSQQHFATALSSSPPMVPSSPPMIPDWRADKRFVADAQIAADRVLTAERALLMLSGYRPPRWFSDLTLMSNYTVQLRSHLSVGGSRVSTTANLIHLKRADGCSAFLGVGHTHRAEGHLNRKFRKDVDYSGTMRTFSSSSRWRRALRKMRNERDPTAKVGVSQPGRRLGKVDTNKNAFQFGYRYTHFLYTIQPRQPFRMLSTSSEFCLSASQDPTDCESVQFISSIALTLAGDKLILAYGVNDCEAKIGLLPVDRVWEMLKPLPLENGTCEVYG